MPFAKANHLLTGWYWGVLDASIGRISFFTSPEDVEEDETPLFYCELQGATIAPAPTPPSRLSVSPAHAGGSEVNPSVSHLTLTDAAGRTHRLGLSCAEDALHWLTHIADAIALVRYLAECSTRQTEPLEGVLHALRTHSSLLNVVNVSLTVADAALLGSLLGGLVTLKAASFNGCDLNDATVSCLAQGLSTSNITVLNLAHNRISNAGMVDLCDALSVNMHLSSLCLAYNDISDDAIAALATMLSSNVTLTDIDLSDTFITDDGVDRLAQVLTKESALTSLKLSNNDIHDRGITALARALPSSPLTTLNVSGCYMTDKGALEIASALATGDTALTHLDVSSNVLLDPGIASLRRAAAHATGFQCLSIGGGGVTTAAVRDLGQLLPDASSSTRADGRFECTSLVLTRKFASAETDAAAPTTTA